MKRLALPAVPGLPGSLLPGRPEPTLLASPIALEEPRKQEPQVTPSGWLDSAALVT